MTAEECIKGRRSVRKFSDQPLTKETMDEILELARFAPSWKNTQVARYHVIQDPALKDAVADQCMMGFQHNTKTTKGAQALVVMTIVNGLSGFEADGSFTTDLEDRWQSFDGGIACQTFCLAAHSVGVGSVIMGIFDQKEIVKCLPIPEGEKVCALIAMGYPLDPTKAGPPRMEAAEISTYY